MNMQGEAFEFGGGAGFEAMVWDAVVGCLEL